MTMTVTKYHPLILASHSTGRKQLLESLNIPFFQFPAKVDEEKIIQSLNNTHPRKIPLILAREKNKVARERLEKEEIAYRYLLTADTVILTENRTILGKPHDEETALQMLKELQGKTHEVISACVMWDTSTQKLIEKISSALVTFRKSSEKALNLYVKSQEPIGKAGGYAIQGAGSFLIEKVEGSVATVIGLPLEELMDILYDIKNQEQLTPLK